VSSDNFILHPQLAADTFEVGDLPLCRVLLMNNARFPWLILVPRRANKKELFDLAPAEYKLVMDEIRFVAEQLKSHTQADKINIAALGNMVPQLHIHIIARFENDAAWPNPVWNFGLPATTYETEKAAAVLYEIRTQINITNL